MSHPPLEIFVSKLRERLSFGHDQEKHFLWSEAELLSELARVDVWALFFFSESEISFYAGTSIDTKLLSGKLGALKSFVLFRKTDESLFDLMFVASLEPAKGWARAALQGAVKAFQGLGLSLPIQILLEVRRSNKRAIEFYRKFGFEQIGLRKGYYPGLDSGVEGKKNPREDALVMRYQLGD